MGAIAIKGLDHVVLRVRNLDTSLAFYCGVLGCTEDRRIDEVGLIQLRAGAAQIDLVSVDSPLGKMGGAAPGADAHNLDHFAVELDAFDGEAIADHLCAHGVEPGEIGTRYGARGNGPSMYIKDPDGNTVELKGPPSD